jgi:hypothetical protein
MAVSRKAVCLPAVFFLMIFISMSWAQEAKPKHAPDALPGVEPEMLTPGYWIALQDDADEVIMTPGEIERFNERVRTKNVEFKDRFGKKDPMLSNFDFKLSIGLLMNPVLPLELADTVSGDSLRDILKSDIEYLFSRDFYDGRNAIYSDRMKKEIYEKINIAGVPDTITRRFGIIVNRANMRLYPTSTPGFSETRWAMDYFQTSALYTIKPVAILYESVDGDFYYVESPTARGWVAAKEVALAEREEIRKLVEDDNLLMATANKVPIYGDPSFKNFVRYFYFSSTTPLINYVSNGYVVKLPYRKPDGSLDIAIGYVKPDADVNIGYLPYTKRNVLTQIFKLLNQPYGWAGQHNNRYCSGTQRVLLNCFGIVVGSWPNFILAASDNLVYIDPALSTEEKIAQVSEIEPVITMAGTGGHVVLYLGKARNGKLYYIHNAGWGYKDDNGEQLTVNRVAVNEATFPWYRIDGVRMYSTFRP